MKIKRRNTHADERTETLLCAFFAFILVIAFLAIILGDGNKGLLDLF